MIYTLLIYNFILLFSSGFAYCAGKTHKKTELIFRFLVFLVLFIPAAIRYNIGTDYVNYVDLFYSPLNLEETEIAYRYINEWIKNGHYNVQWVFVIAAFVMYFPLCFFIRKKWLFPIILFFVLFFYLKTFSLVRQSIAVCLLLVSICRYLERRNIIELIIGTLLASCFHLSTFLVLPVFLFRKIRLSSFVYFLLIAVSYWGVRKGLIDTIFSNEFFLNSAYGNYASNIFNRETEINSGLGILIFTTVPLCALYYAKELNDKFIMVVISSLAYIFSYLLAVQIHIFNRLVDIYTFAPILAFSVLFMTVLKKKKKLLLVLLLLNFLNYQKVIVNSKSSLHEGLGVTPYTTIFNK